MKRFFLCVLVTIGLCDSLSAQNQDPAAQKILDGVSAKYKSVKTVKATFKLVTANAQSQSTDIQSGTFYVKGNKFKVEMNSQEITCDNSTIWTYLKDGNEVQINTYQPTADQISPSQIFTIYQKNFLYAYVDEEPQGGKTLQVIDLTPSDKSKKYYKVRLSIDKAAQTIYSAEIFEKSGTRYTYTVLSQTPDLMLADTFFTFDPKAHPGVDVEDLR